MKQGSRAGKGSPGSLVFSTENLSYESPVISPSLSTSIRSAAGRSGKPGIRTMSPVRATKKPALCGDLDVADGEGEALGPAPQRGVIRQGILESSPCRGRGAVPEFSRLLRNLASALGRMFTPSARIHDLRDPLEFPLDGPFEG